LKLIKDLILVPPDKGHAGFNKKHTLGAVPGPADIAVMGILPEDHVGHHIIQDPLFRG
jgi:hypothetical protein